MSNYSVLKQDINNNIYENQTQQITGTVLNAILNEMTASLGAGYQFAGVATLGMNPGDPDQRVFYLAGEGIYTNFGGIQVPAGKLGVLKWDNRWTLQTIDGLGGGGANLTGYVSVASTDDLPEEGQPTLGYLCGTNLYLYVGEGGDTKEGKYQDCGSFRGPEGAYIQDIEQTETSHENGGRNTIKMTLSDGRSFNAYVHNGTTSSGLFPTLTALQAAYPTPVVGQYAFVGAGFPADIYVCTTAGTWTDSGEDYDGDNVDLTDYATKAEVNQLEAKVDGVNETVYENEGQVDYYEQNGTFTGWRGTGTYTPALSSDKVINQIIFPPLHRDNQGEIMYLVCHSDSNPTVTAPSSMTRIAEGTIMFEANGTKNDYTVHLDTPITIPAGHRVFVFLYGAYYTIQILGGGTDATELQPYNAEDAVAYFRTTASTTPFSETWYQGGASTSARYKVCCPVLKNIQESSIIPMIDGRLDEVLPEKIEEALAGEETINVYLPNKLYAVVGDTLQVFFNSIVAAINIAEYDIYAECSKGKTYPRYFSYTPVAGDVGTTTLTVYVKDRKNNILGQASCDLVTVSAPSSPVSAKSIFTFGDSLTSQGQWPGEAKRRLVGNSTYDFITGKGLSNIAFFGYLNTVINEQPVNYFGVGGWAWNNYISKSVVGAFRFYVEGVSSLSIGAVYTNNGHSYTVQEVNITDGSGNIRCTTSLITNTPTASGTLTKTSGDGDATITFASFETENANPLWDDANNKMSFIPYVQDCGANTIDAVFVLLSWNGQGAWKEYSADDTQGHIANAKTFARTLHSEYPSAKLFIMGLQMPSETGGLGANYGATTDYIDGYGLKQCALNYNKALQDLCNLDEFSPYCEFVDVASQFDSHYNMPYANRRVNNRNSVTEMLGTNGVHPSDAGYFQIADTVYRSIVANFCQ